MLSYTIRLATSARALAFTAGLFLISIGSADTASEWTNGAGFRSRALPVPTDGQPGFKLMPPDETGVRFTNSLAFERYMMNQILLNGSGVAAGDVDQDGWCDLYFCNLDGPNALYRNLGGWRFEEITETADVSCPNLDATGAAFADWDGDGDLDLFVNSVGGGTHLFVNDGHAHFTKSSLVLNPSRGGTSLTLGDFDQDGDLDLYVANYRTSALMDMPNAHFSLRVVDGRQIVERVNGRPTTEPDLTNRFSVSARGGIDEHGEPDILYRNSGGTHFEPVPFISGTFLDEDGRPLTIPPFDWGLSAVFRDLNADALPDLFVCNDFTSPDRIWINQGGGRFRLIDRLAIRKSSHFCMGVDFADVNRDGYLDFLTLDMLSRLHTHRMIQMGDRNPTVPQVGQIDNRPQYMLTQLFLNRGDGTYAEIGQFAGLGASDWSWSPLFLDVDLDGWEDLLVTTGHERDGRNLDVADQLRTLRTQKKMTPLEILQARKIFPRLDTPNLAFRNGRNLTFREVGAEWGFDLRGVSHGMAAADLDNDGDLDVAVNNLNQAAALFQNNSTAPRLAVRLKGRPPNSFGVGAFIQVGGGPVNQSHEIVCGGHYLSSDEFVRVFAAGNLTNHLSIQIRWPNGTRSALAQAAPNRLYEITEPPPNTGSERTQPVAAPPPFFRDMSPLLQHAHQDEFFDDHARQPLLPNRLSQLGPAVCWSDLDLDGWEDLVIGTGRGGFMAAFRNDRHGAFTRLETAPFQTPISRDQTAILPWRKGTLVILLAGSANYEDGLPMGSSVRQFHCTRRLIEDSFPPFPWSCGPMAMADWDGDGDLDLFVGGRAVAGRYPEPAGFALFRNAGATFELANQNAAPLASTAGLDMISGALFSDLDADGDPDLVWACDWGPIRIFRNDGGHFAPWLWPISFSRSNQTSTLDQLTGWWNGINAGDFDRDGRLDLVASNWGRNTKYEEYKPHPLQLFYADFDGDGALELVEAHFDPVLNKVVPERGLSSMARALPFLKERFPTHLAYGQAAVDELLGPHAAQAKIRAAAWLDTTLFLNRGDYFEVRTLPFEAQFSPAFGIVVTDLDGDGHEDLFLSQNLFCSDPETPRGDAGRGLWLRGLGRGDFEAVPGQTSGLLIYGEQRGCAAADYDADGRVDLVVSQNGAATKLFHNEKARPGWRIRLNAGPNNPTGVGAVLRVVSPDRAGPAREIHAGSGFWSHDSVVQVLSKPDRPAQLDVRWPGGKRTRNDLPSQAREIELTAAGQLTVLR